MRSLSNWLSCFLEYTTDTESPDLFFFWTGVSILSSTIGRNVHMPMGFYDVFPNHYIILCAKSAVCRKGIPVNLAKHLLVSADTTKIMAQRITNPGLITRLSKTAKEIGRGEMLVWASEMATFFSEEETHKGLKVTLTDIYDCPDPFVNELKGDEKPETIPQTCLNVLCATNPTDLVRLIPDAAFGTGFASRLHIIYQETRKKKVSRQSRDLSLERKLIEDLKHIKTIEGTFSFAEGGTEFWDRWYNSIEFPGDEKLDSFYGRKHAHMLRLAMVLSIASKDDLTLTPEIMQTAVVAVDQLEAFLPNVYRNVGKTTFSSDMDRIVKQIKMHGGSATASQLLHDNWGLLKARDGSFKEIMDQLEAANVLSCESYSNGRRIVYTLLKQGEE